MTVSETLYDVKKIIEVVKNFLFAEDFDMLAEWVEIEPILPERAYAVSKTIVGVRPRLVDQEIIKVDDVYKVRVRLPSAIQKLLERHKYLSKVAEPAGIYRGLYFFIYDIFYKIFDIAEDTMIRLTNIEPELLEGFEEISNFIQEKVTNPKFDHYTDYFRIAFSLRHKTINVDYRAINSTDQVGEFYKLRPLDNIIIRYIPTDIYKYFEYLGSYILRNLNLPGFLFAINPVRREQLYIFSQRFGEI